MSLVLTVSSKRRAKENEPNCSGRGGGEKKGSIEQLTARDRSKSRGVGRREIVCRATPIHKCTHLNNFLLKAYGNGALLGVPAKDNRDIQVTGVCVCNFLSDRLTDIPRCLKLIRAKGIKSQISFSGE